MDSNLKNSERPATDSPPNKSGLLADSAILFSTNAFASMLGFAFHLAVARLGGPKVYADLGALISLVILMAVFGLSIQVYVASRVAWLSTAGISPGSYLGRLLRNVFFATLPLAGLLILVHQPLSRFLNLVDPWGVVLLGLLAFPLLALSTIRGGLQGAQKFVGLGSLRLVETVLQLTFGVGLVYLGLKAPGAIAGTLIGMTGALVVGWIFIRPSFAKPPTSRVPGSKADHVYLVRIILFSAFVVALTNFDVLLVKHHFVHAQSAQYVAASFMSRILYLSAVAVGMALFPKTTVLPGPEARRLLARAMGYFLAFAIPFVGFCSLFPGWVVGLFYGDLYAETAVILPKLLFAYTLIGVAYLLGMYRLSRGWQVVFLPFAAATIIELFAITLWPDSIQRVAWYLVGCALVLSVTAFIPTGHRQTSP